MKDGDQEKIHASIPLGFHSKTSFLKKRKSLTAYTNKRANEVNEPFMTSMSNERGNMPLHCLPSAHSTSRWAGLTDFSSGNALIYHSKNSSIEGKATALRQLKHCFLHSHYVLYSLLHPQVFGLPEGKPLKIGGSRGNQ